MLSIILNVMENICLYKFNWIQFSQNPFTYLCFNILLDIYKRQCRYSLFPINNNPFKHNRYFFCVYFEVDFLIKIKSISNNVSGTASKHWRNDILSAEKKESCCWKRSCYEVNQLFFLVRERELWIRNWLYIRYKKVPLCC